MSESVVRSRIDPAIKTEATRLLNSMGLTMSDAIRLFLHQIITEQALPFSVKAPNAKTIAAMAAADRGEGEETSLEELAHDWDLAACEE